MRTKLASAFAAPLILAGALLMLAVALLAAGCGAPQTVTVGQGANGTTVKVATGGTVVISLVENPTTGYEWNMKLGNGLKLLETHFKSDDTGAQLAGAPGVRTWRVEVTEAGEHTISGAYERSWESKDPEKTYTLTVSAE